MVSTSVSAAGQRVPGATWRFVAGTPAVEIFLDTAHIQREGDTASVAIRMVTAVSQVAAGVRYSQIEVEERMGCQTRSGQHVSMRALDSLGNEVGGGGFPVDTAWTSFEGQGFGEDKLDATCDALGGTWWADSTRVGRIALPDAGHGWLFVMKGVNGDAFVDTARMQPAGKAIRLWARVTYAPPVRQDPNVSVAIAQVEFLQDVDCDGEMVRDIAMIERGVDGITYRESGYHPEWQPFTTGEHLIFKTFCANRTKSSSSVPWIYSGAIAVALIGIPVFVHWRGRKAETETMPPAPPL